MAARCSSPAVPRTSSATRMSAASIWAKVSSCKMALGPRLDLRQSQSLVMTPQLQQAIRLLALSNLEVESFIAEEIEKNPLLETGSGDGDEEVPGEAVAEFDGEPGGEPAPPEIGAGGGDAALDLDQDSEDFHQDSAADSLHGLDLEGISGGGAGGEGADFDSFAAGEVSLHDHLRRQAGETLSGADLIVAGLIIDQIDETGYFTASLLDIADKLGAPLREVER